jgi:CRISPR-associated protein Cas5d
VVPTGRVESAMRSGKGDLGLYIEDDRQQRAGLFLRDVAYRAHARMELVPESGENNTLPKFLDMFERRAEKGQCFNQPYLGCREFAADFRLVDPSSTGSTSIDESRDLGWMLYDLDYEPKDGPRPMFFRAGLERGVMRVPAIDSEEMRR